jgi:succinate dehydrogenase (ubiquinone) cytochrome b560 subunit
VSGIAVLTLMGVNTSDLMTVIGNSAVGPVFKLGVSFTLIYHYLAGVRHIMWDANPEMLHSDKVTKSSYILIGGATTLSVIAASL